VNYYEIAPLTYLGQNTSVLTYSSSDKLLVGQAVLISLRTKKVIGIILSNVNKPPFQTKEILNVIFDKPIIDKARLELANWMADYYAANLVNVLQTFVPSGIQKKRRSLETVKKSREKDSIPVPTKDQALAINNILGSSDNKPHLVFGVTGSGKTEVYFNLIERELNNNKQVILLVPEISLTPMMIQRLESRFGNKVVLLHSYLKETDRYAKWKAILNNEASIVIGSRSALFAPLNNLGLIIIDEEHESSYKQDQTPRYNTVRVAEKLSQILNCRLVLGSATPSLNSYYKSSRGSYHLQVLNKRIVQDSLPKVEIVDMRNEFKYGNMSIFSERLQENIQSTLKERKQILLFINRRGMSTFVSCRDCGYVANCPHCDLALTFHYNNLNLICHHCGYTEKIPTICPSCQSTSIKFFGTGTQRVETELKKLIGDKFTVERMDKDTTKQRGRHELLYKNFANKNTDVLIGTQMITKGWDLKNIGLVGIISADTMINFPDFTASEKTFDLLTQVAGRTGRGLDQGKVILQTYNPESKAIIYAAKHDYVSFYNDEILDRRSLNYPPFAHYIKLLYTNKEQNTAEEKANILAEKIKNLNDRNIIDILGPTPAFLPKVAGRFRWQISLQVKDVDEQQFIKTVRAIKKLANNQWVIDVDATGVI
jgi:primosomal protein N' (replication factor Y)